MKALFKSNIKLKQIVTLFSVNIISIPLTIGINILLTRYLGTIGYGDYVFILNIFNISVIFISLGFFQAGNRALVLNNDERKAKQLYGAELIICFILCIILILFLYIYAYVDTNLTEKGLKGFFLYLVPFSGIFLLYNYFEVLFPADNKIKLLALSRLLPKIIFFIFVVLIYLFLIHITSKLSIIWFAFLFSQIIVIIFIILKIRVSFVDVKKRIAEVWHFNKTYGFNVFQGSVFAVGFSFLAGILISYYSVDNKGVGFYSLALTFSTPLTLIPNVIATTHYKDFSTKNEIPKKVLRITIFMSLMALIFIWLVVPLIVPLFYGKEFYSVIKLSYIISIGMILHGLANFFNRFLASHGEGKFLRNASFVVGSTMLMLNFLLIPIWAETGAAISRAVNGLVYLLVIIWFYSKFRRKQKLVF